MVHESFMDAPRGRIPMPRRGDPFVGGHALCFVGFDAASSSCSSPTPGARRGATRASDPSATTFSWRLMDAWGMVDAVDFPQAPMP